MKIYSPNLSLEYNEIIEDGPFGGEGGEQVRDQ